MTTNQAEFYALAGSITSGVIQTNEQTWFRAGEDIRGMTYTLRNIRPTDVSLLEAGRDIIGSKPLQTHLSQFGLNDPVTGADIPVGSIAIQGPGALVISAGRNVYGDTTRLQTNGNQSYDPGTNEPIVGSKVMGLPEQGALITVMAGINHAPSYDAFATAYLDPANVAAMPSYLKTTLPDGAVVPLYLTNAFESRSNSEKMVRRGLVSFIKDMTGETLSPLDAWARFQTLQPLAQQRFLRDVYMQELRDASRDENTIDSNGGTKNDGINRGYAAISTLFPGGGWKGDISFNDGGFITQGGGNIEVLVPGGGLQLAALNRAVPAGSGIITLGYGDIRVFTRDDVTVNRSRILTFAGGDGLIWSTLGDIDAGRGAKTTRVPAAPNVVTDADANTKVTERADVSGSGIGTVSGFAGVEEGDFDLIAPKGTVNAGDAGIRVSGNFNIITPIFLNADNLSVSGLTRGVPQVQVPNIGGLTEASNTAGAAAQQASGPKQGSGNAQPSIIIVEVLGFGGGDGESKGRDTEEESRRSKDRRSYNPADPIKIVGYGALTSADTQNLTDEEKAKTSEVSRAVFRLVAPARCCETG